MNAKKYLTVLMALTVLLLALTGCGASETVETTAAGEIEATELPMGLSSWSMNATTWSSPNGATVNLTAVPTVYEEGQCAAFVVRMEGDEVANVPCQWDGAVYTASAELNAADGYCYYVILTAADGAQTEVGVNVPNAPTDETLINLADALNSYCNAAVSASTVADGKLTITEGTANIQLPRITRDEGQIVCQQAVLVLSYNGEDVAQEALTVPAADDKGVCTADLAGITFTVPADMEDDHQLSMRMDLTLSNGQTLSAAGGTWYYLDGNLLLAVG